MMEIIKFVIWVVRKLSPAEMMGWSFMSWVVILFVNLYFFGPIGFVIFFAGVVLVALIYLIRNMCEGVLKSWKKYKDEQDREAQRIVNRLKGI